jgi:hypothetical protein
MPGDRLELRIDLDMDAADADERDEAARALGDELRELDVDAVRRPTQPAPPGTRGAEAAMLGTLVVTVGRTALSAVAGAIQQWLSRRGGRSVTLELDGDRIEVAGLSTGDQQRLIETFVARHAGG